MRNREEMIRELKARGLSTSLPAPVTTEKSAAYLIDRRLPSLEKICVDAPFAVFGIVSDSSGLELAGVSCGWQGHDSTIGEILLRYKANSSLLEIIHLQPYIVDLVKLDWAQRYDFALRHGISGEPIEIATEVPGVTSLRTWSDSHWIAKYKGYSSLNLYLAAVGIRVRDLDALVASMRRIDDDPEVLQAQQEILWKHLRGPDHAS